jgi:hypothetical protein
LRLSTLVNRIIVFGMVQIPSTKKNDNICTVVYKSSGKGRWWVIVKT